MSSKSERELKKLLEDEGWFVARAAGSLGDADLLAVRPLTERPRHVFHRLRDEKGYISNQMGHISFSWLIEDKSTQGLVKYLKPDENKQWKGLYDLTQKGFNCLFAVRYKDPSLRGKTKWSFFIVDRPGPPGPLKYAEEYSFEGLFG